MKKIYKTANVMEIENGFQVQLDGRMLKTPAGKMLVLPNAKMAKAVAEEWNAQGDEIKPHTMPLTQFAMTAFDHIAPEPAAAHKRILDYCDGELVCHYAREPESLRELQQQHWKPMLEWINAEAGTHLAATHGLLGKVCSEDDKAILQTKIKGLDCWNLIALQSAVLVTGSFVLGYAFFKGRLSDKEVFAAAELESIYQIEKWGSDAEAEKRHAAIKLELQNIARWLELVS